MYALTVALSCWVLFAGAGFVGLLHKRTDELKASRTVDAMKQLQTIMTSMAALVLGLLVSSATENFRTQSRAVSQMASEVLLLDRALIEFGPETREARGILQREVESTIAALWSNGERPLEPSANFLRAVAVLQPNSPEQTFLHARSLDILVGLTRTRSGLITAAHSYSMQWPLVVALAIWYTLIFLPTGLLAPRSRILFLSVVATSGAVAGALFIVLTMDQPFSGIVSVPSVALERAAGTIGRP